MLALGQWPRQPSLMREADIKPTAQSQGDGGWAFGVQTRTCVNSPTSGEPQTGPVEDGCLQVERVPERKEGLLSPRGQGEGQNATACPA